MVGRAGGQPAIYVAKTKSGSASPAQEPEDTQTAAASDVSRTQPAARKQPAGSAGLSSSRAKNGTEAIKSGNNAASTGGLIVYEKGKVIFQMTPAQKSYRSATEPAAETSRQDENVKESDTSPASNPLPVSAETASAYLIHRIEPQYPTQAREQHIQGPVVLSAVVNKAGSVEVLKVVSGDPQLAFFQFHDAVNRAPRRRCNCVFQQCRVIPGLQNHGGGAQRSLSSEQRGHIARQPHLHARFRQRFQDDVDIRRATSRESGHRIHMLLVHDHRFSDHVEQCARSLHVPR